MHYTLDLAISEEIYLSFNDFHSFESTYGKKQLKNGRILFLSLIGILVVLSLTLMKFSRFAIIYSSLLFIFTVIYMLLYRKILSKSMVARIKRMKKIGKLPYDPLAKLEFYDDRLVEITPNTRIEQHYSCLEQICVVGERFVLIYHTSISAYILPISQIKAQLDMGEFLKFLSAKCNRVEYY